MFKVKGVNLDEFLMLPKPTDITFSNWILEFTRNLQSLFLSAVLLKSNKLANGLKMPKLLIIEYHTTEIRTEIIFPWDFSGGDNTFGFIPPFGSH